MFFNRSQYPKLAILEENYEVILQEFLYLTGAKMRTWTEKEKFSGSWKVFGFYHCGRKLETCCKYCPETTKIIESIGEVYMAGFSTMAPKTQIHQHVDDVPDGLSRVHLGIQVPTGIRCGFWVDGERKQWKNGEAFLFNPKKIHKAWNMTDENRVVLLLDYKRI